VLAWCTPIPANQIRQSRRRHHPAVRGRAVKRPPESTSTNIPTNHAGRGDGLPREGLESVRAVQPVFFLPANSSGDLKAIAAHLAGAKTPILPDVPTFAESRSPGSTSPAFCLWAFFSSRHASATWQRTNKAMQELLAGEARQAASLNGARGVPRLDAR